jgi:hypothetical protein
MGIYGFLISTPILFTCMKNIVKLILNWLSYMCISERCHYWDMQTLTSFSLFMYLCIHVFMYIPTMITCWNFQLSFLCLPALNSARKKSTRHISRLSVYVVHSLYFVWNAEVSLEWSAPEFSLNFRARRSGRVLFARDKLFLPEFMYLVDTGCILWDCLIHIEAGGDRFQEVCCTERWKTRGDSQSMWWEI